MRNHIMTDQHVLRYLELVDRLLWIMRHSGTDWKPEYEEEGNAIRAELEAIRPIVEEERRMRDAEEAAAPGR